MKRIIEIVLLIVILIISGLVLVLQIKKNEILPNDKIKSEMLNLDLFTKQSIYEAVINNNKDLKFSEKLIFNHKLDKDFSVNRPVLVFRYSAYNCNVCTEFGIKKLEENFSDYKNNADLLFILSDFPLDNKIEYSNFIDLNKERLGIPLENANLPFFFMLIGGHVQHVFIPDSNLPEYTDIYLKEVKKRYFDN